MSIEKLLEGLEGTDDAELEDTRFDLDILDDVLTGLPDTDEDGNPISSHLYADSIMEVYGIDRGELIELLKSSGRGLRFFDLSIEDMGSELVVGNSMCTEDDVRNDFLASLDGLEDIEFTVTEIVDDSSDDSKAATGTATKEPTGPLRESTTVGPDSVFGYINGDLESFDPWSFVNKVRRRKMSLHTNRMVRDTDNLKVCHHIVCSVMGLGDKPSVFVDVVEETWERDTSIGDADSIDNYKGKMTQERILSRDCGNGEDGFNEAILVLEEYKEKTLKNMSSGGHGGNHGGNASGDTPSGSLTESKEDQQKFIDKFGQDVFNLFNKSKDRLKNANISTDILYHVKNTDVDDMKNILHNLQAKVVKTDGVGTDLTKIQGKYNFLGSKDGYDVYEPLDVTASMSLGVGSGWCTTGRYGHAGEVEEDIEKHDTLNPKLFENDELKEDVREALKRVVDAFVADLRESDIDLAVKDAVIVGSNVNYNYTDDSDLDLHIIADSSKSSYPGEILTLLYSAYRSIFNKNYDITIKGIPCEVYVELDETGTDSNGVYSLFSGWIRKPEHEDVPDLDEEGFNKLFGEWEDRYFKLLDTLGVEPGELLATGC